MTDVRLNPELTEAGMDRVATELMKLSNLHPVKQRLEEKNSSLLPLPESEMQGSRPRDNNVFQKDYVEGALELAEMLGIADKGSVNPSKGLSFKAKNYKYYDFMEFWTALIQRFQSNEQRLSELKRLSETLNTNMQALFDYAESSTKLSSKQLETFKASVNGNLSAFEEAAELITQNINTFSDARDDDNTFYSALIAELRKKNKRLKLLLWGLAAFVAIPCIYVYYTLIAIIFFGG